MNVLVFPRSVCLKLNYSNRAHGGVHAPNRRIRARRCGLRQDLGSLHFTDALRKARRQCAVMGVNVATDQGWCLLATPRVCCDPPGVSGSVGIAAQEAKK